jgi:hypothetical protein
MVFMLLRLCFTLLILMIFIYPAQAVTPAAMPVLQTVTACGNDVPLKFDVLPATNASPPYSAVVVVHGGGWLGGSRTDLHGLLQQLSRMGFVAMSVDYRLAPAARFPAQIEDVKCAVRWLRSHAVEYQINPEKLVHLVFPPVRICLHWQRLRREVGKRWWLCWYQQSVAMCGFTCAAAGFCRLVANCRPCNTRPHVTAGDAEIAAG